MNGLSQMQCPGLWNSAFALEVNSCRSIGKTSLASIPWLNRSLLKNAPFPPALSYGPKGGFPPDAAVEGQVIVILPSTCPADRTAR